MAGLSNKRRAFIEYYLQSFNATEAARRAGYKQPHSQGPRLLENVEIQAAKEARIAEVAMGADEVLLRLGQQARAEYAAYLRDDGTVDLAKILADGKAHLIKGIKWDAQGHKIVEFYDAHAALVDIGKHLKLFSDTVDVRITDWTKLSDEQLKRIIDGESPIAVLAPAGGSGDGAPSAAGEAQEPTA